jgi:hypothetical protein
VQYDTLSGKRHWSWYRIAHCQAKYTGCGTVWHIARWNTLVVIPYDILLGERDWLWYRITHCQVKYTGCGTAWHIAKFHWSWYRIPHCQVKYTGCGTVWHIAMWNTLFVLPYYIMPSERHWSWYRMTHCQMKGTGRGTLWHIVRWYRMTHFNTWPRWKRIQNLHKFRNYKSIRQHVCFCVNRKCKITYFYVTNNPFRLNVTLFFFVWSFTTNLFNFVSIDNKDGHHIEGIC